MAVQFLINVFKATVFDIWRGILLLFYMHVLDNVLNELGMYHIEAFHAASSDPAPPAVGGL